MLIHILINVNTFLRVGVLCRCCGVAPHYVRPLYPLILVWRGVAAAGVVACGHDAGEKKNGLPPVLLSEVFFYAVFIGWCVVVFIVFLIPFPPLLYKVVY